MTYPCKRRFDIRSMGQWLYKNRGRPDISDSRQWRETSNFVLNVVAKVVPCEGYATENGWLIDILGASPGENISDYFISVDFASSNMALRKHLMKAFPAWGGRCRDGQNPNLSHRVIAERIFIGKSKLYSAVHTGTGVVKVGSVHTPVGPLPAHPVDLRQIIKTCSQRTWRARGGGRGLCLQGLSWRSSAR